MLSTPAQLQAEFARWAFTPPGIELKLHTRADGALPYAYEAAAVLRILIRTRNTYRPEDPTEDVVTHATQIPLPMPREYWPHFLRQSIHAAVCHEADEWLRRDGIMLFDPHATR